MAEPANTITLPAVTALPPDDRSRYLNRELSWLEFNWRVLHQALDERTPLLERVKFLSIFNSNLDEFFMKRVGGLKRQIIAGVTQRSLDGLTAAEQLSKIREVVTLMLEEQATCFREEIKPRLGEQAGIFLLKWDDLSVAEQREATTYFHANILPVAIPLTVDQGHPFPFISNLSRSLGVALRHPELGEPVFARVKAPQVLPPWIRLESDSASDEYRFVSLLGLMGKHLDELFREMDILGVMPFRITRNADVEREEEDAEDLLELIEEELRARRFASVVRLEHRPDADPWVLNYLIEELNLSEQDIYEQPSQLDYTDLAPLAELPLPGLKFPTWSPRVPAPLADDQADIFTQIRRDDILVHHPYQSFSASVERFIRIAADDPSVMAIKMTLYRTGDQSPFINTLIRAAESGKQVVCVVELKARFDEQRNIQVAQKLEKAGAHVVYGMVGLKTHTKTALIVRRESDGVRCYAHIGTGNYNAGTARLYTDLGLFTADPAYTRDLVELFHYLTGRSLQREYAKLLVAPINMRQRFMEMIEREIVNQQIGRPSHIIAKMNSLEDKTIIEALYRASQAGVVIDLIVRGFCCLRPGVPGMSENIRVISIVGRFLEHSRLFYFRDGEDDPVNGRFFIGSADWMYRNLENRIEAVTPIEDRPLRAQCLRFLETMLDDQRLAWNMAPDGSYQRFMTADPHEQPGSQQALMELTPR